MECHLCSGTGKLNGAKREMPTKLIYRSMQSLLKYQLPFIEDINKLIL